MNDRFRKQLWLLPLAIIVHNVEEYLALDNFATKSMFPIASEQILIAQILITIAVIVLLVLGHTSSKKSRVFFLILVIIPGLLINAVTHIAQMVIFRMYTPGVFSAMLILLPLGIYLLQSARLEGYIKKGELVKLFFAAALILVTTLVLAHVAASLIVNIFY